MTRIAVTGATGFVGRHLLPMLVERGDDVRALVRYGSDTSGIDDRVQLVYGHLRSLDSLRPLPEGCDVLIHLAPGLADEEDTVRDIVEGTENLVTLAKEENLPRFVYVSCLGAEAASTAPEYASRWKAETLVRGSGLAWTILRPSLILGPNDGFLRPLAGLMRSLPLIPIFGKGDHRLQPIDVHDFCRCLVLASDSADLSDRSISVGGPLFVTWRQLIDLVAAELGISKRKLLLPARLASRVGPVLPKVARPLVAPSRLALLRHGVVASPGIVKREFGFEPSSVLPKLGEYLGALN